MAKEFEPNSGKALIFIYRDTPKIGISTKMRVFIDQKEIAGTIPESYIRVESAPGIHEVISRTESDSALTLAVEAGRLYFIRQEPKMGWKMSRSRLTLSSEDKGRAAVLKCRLVKNVI